MPHPFNNFVIDPQSNDLLCGLQELASLFPEKISPGGTPLSFESSLDFNGFRITKSPKGVTVAYARPCDAYRAFGVLLGGCEFPDSGVIEEACAFDSLGVMLDVSRNGVLRPEALLSLFRSFALMGINSVQLYMEDVYVLPDEPFFGYARGAYTEDELKMIDDHAHRLGIEVIASIQTLGHMEQALQWAAYNDIADNPRVLLADSDATYNLIEKMLDTVSRCFQSRTVHIGMDEAFGVGEGKYRKVHGEKRPFDILNGHLKKVTRLCTDRGLDPLMWSDMYFRLGSATHDYYDKNAVIPADVSEMIPKEAHLVYWDYYSVEQSFYEMMIDRHRSLGKEPLYAGGVWNWGRLWSCLPHAFSTLSAGMKAARSKNLRRAFVTSWGDDGAECDPFSILPAIQYFAEFAYTSEPEIARLEKLFAVSSRSSFSGCVLASSIDIIPSIEEAPIRFANFGKWLLWSDPVINFLDQQIPAELPAHYAGLSAKLERYDEASDPEGALRFPAVLARLLAGKTRLHLEVKKSYRERDCGRMGELSTLLSETIAATEELWKLHRAIWRRWYKPFGWEVIDARYAALASRLETLRELLAEFMSDPSVRIPEFEYETQRIHPESHYPEMFFGYRRLLTASVSS